MQRFFNKLRPQGVLTVFGLFMLSLAALGFFAASTEIPAQGGSTPAGGLKVSPAKSFPKPVIDNLQGAKGLQSQGSQNLQSPVGDQLQPNAKTGSLNSTSKVQ